MPFLSSQRLGYAAGKPPPRSFTVREPRHVPYFRATRHPLACLLFLLPLLAAYEGGVLWVGGAQPEALRNGADTSLRYVLDAFGLRQLYWAPALVIAVFLARCVGRWHDRPEDTVGAWLGMAIESIVYALALWGLSRGLGPALDSLGIDLNLASEEGVAEVVTYVGAGIYEEVLFRLVLYTGLVALLRLLQLPGFVAMFLAALASATAFAGAHHIGPHGEAFDEFVFLFRALAGLYFAFLYQVRGFGIAVGTHACYDVLVGIAVG